MGNTQGQNAPEFLNCFPANPSTYWTKKAKSLDVLLYGGAVKAVLTRFPFWEYAPLCAVEHESLFRGVISAKRPPRVADAEKITGRKIALRSVPRVCG